MMRSARTRATAARWRRSERDIGPPLKYLRHVDHLEAPALLFAVRADLSHRPAAHVFQDRRKAHARSLVRDAGAEVSRCDPNEHLASRTSPGSARARTPRTPRRARSAHRTRELAFPGPCRRACAPVRWPPRIRFS